MEQQHHQDDNLPHMTRSDNEDDECPMGTVHRCIPERPSRWLDDPNDLDQDVGDCEINVLSQCNNCNAQEIGSLPTSGTATQMMTLDKQWTQSTTLSVPSIRCVQQWNAGTDGLGVHAEVLTKDLQRDTEQETHLCQLMHQWEDDTHDVTAQGVVHHSVFNGRLQFKKENPCLHCQEARPLSSNKTQCLHTWLQDG